MNWVKKWHWQKTASDAVEMLTEKGYDARYAETADDAKQTVLDLIPEGSSVAVGGSVTIGDMGLIDIFRSDKYKFFERFNTSGYAETYQVYRQSFLADYLVTSSNAITMNGEIVNTDSSGNRAAGIILGPERVIIVVGANKIVPDLNAAFERIRQIAPLNAKRIGHHCPCVETGYCVDCDSPESVCNATSIIHNGRKHPGRYTVIVVAEELGF